jgi:hypothetical protein
MSCLPMRALACRWITVEKSEQSRPMREACELAAGAGRGGLCAFVFSPQQLRQLGDAERNAPSLVAGEHLFRNVPTFGRLRVSARGPGRITRRVAITPDGRSYRIAA